MLFIYIYLMFLIMMGTYLSQSFLQLFFDSTQISTEFIFIKTFCIKYIYYKCIYPMDAFTINAFAINAFLSLLIYHKIFL